MREPRTINYGGEYMKLHPNGDISRPKIKMGPSGKWKVTGAVTRNNFGHVVRRWSLQEILDNPAMIPWKHANGKQKTFIQDLDHGTHREWRSPGHSVI